MPSSARKKIFSREEWLTVYINTILEQCDPHTSYFAQDDKQRFDESMAGAMEGIGAVLYFNDAATADIYTLSLHDALPISLRDRQRDAISAPDSRFERGAE